MGRVQHSPWVFCQNTFASYRDSRTNSILDHLFVQTFHSLIGVLELFALFWANDSGKTNFGVSPCLEEGDFTPLLSIKVIRALFGCQHLATLEKGFNPNHVVGVHPKGTRHDLVGLLYIVGYSKHRKYKQDNSRKNDGISRSYRRHNWIHSWQWCPHGRHDLRWLSSDSQIWQMPRKSWRPEASTSRWTLNAF